MAVKRRLSGYSGMRLDWPHVRSIESAASADFDSVLRGLVTGLQQPYVIRGFKVKIPDSAINASSLQIVVSDSALLHSSAGESGTILTVPSGTPDEKLDSSNTKVIGAFQNGVPNYVALDYKRVTDTSTIDQTAGWSAAQQLEFQRTVPIGRVMDYRFIITTTGFGTYLPLYIVGVSNTGAVEYITKGGSGLFRLGTGGAVPDPQYSFSYKNLINPQSGDRREWINTRPDLTPNPVTVVPGDPAEAFDYGDWSITSLKEWMDAVMTRFKELTGSSYWYTDSALTQSNTQLFDVWFDSAGSVLTGSGYMSYNLILEALQPTDGAFQTKFTDPTILPGDSYIIGASSGNRGNLNSFNNAQLIVNSLIKDGFAPLETLYNRRILRHNSNLFELRDYDDGIYRYGRYQRKPNGSGAYTVITSWSYDNDLVTVNTATPHGLQPAQVAEIKDLDVSLGGDNPPNGVAFIKHIPTPTSFQFLATVPISGSPTLAASPGVRLDDQTLHPYIPKYVVTGWSYSGANITVSATNHTFKSPVNLTATRTISDDTLTGISSTAQLKRGMLITGTGIPTNTLIAEILSPTSVRMTKDATASGTSILEFAEQIVVADLTSSTSVNLPNGRWKVTNVQSNGDIEFTASATPTGTATVSATSRVMPDAHDFIIQVQGAIPDGYNVVDVVAKTNCGIGFSYILGPASLPALPPGSGPIVLDGTVAVSQVADPVKVYSIEYVGGDLFIRTFSPHGLTSGGPQTQTFFGDPTLSAYIKTYENITIALVSESISAISRDGAGVVTVDTSTAHGLNPGETVNVAGVTPSDFNGNWVVVSTPTTTQFTFQHTTTGVLAGSGGTVTNLNQFRMVGSDLPNYGLFDNSVAQDPVFVRSPNNPYAGPIQWDSDLILKGIIGDKYFKIPQSATATGTLLANRFNVNGLTGTAYLQDGEVAYIVLKRNILVSAGSLFSTTGGANPIIGSSAPLDEDGNVLQPGDFVKFEDEDESKWMRVDQVIGSQTFLITDRGLTPSQDQRPAKSGRLVYCKGTYSEVIVKAHWQVDSSPDVYWVAVRRDNGSLKSKVYLKALELEQGEVRQINDNEPSNLLVYTGAGSEAAVNPNYTVIDQTGSWQYNQDLTITETETKTRRVTFDEGPDLGFQAGDRFTVTVGSTVYNFTVRFLYSSRSVAVNEDVSIIPITSPAKYYRVNYGGLNDSDNLTLGIRKANRENARINTALTVPIYDESIYIQKMNITLGGLGVVKSGSFIYKGPEDNPTALAWVLHGNVTATETIESAIVGMPGGHPTIGGTAILMHMVSGSFQDGDLLYQNGVSTGCTVNNPGNPSFEAPTVAGGTSHDGVELVLPPNRRTQSVGSSYVVWPNHAYYKATLDPILTGEDLLVVVNDALRQANVDYEETFGGPKGKIKLIRDLPPNTRMRFRTLTAFGSALAAKSGAVDLQSAYNVGNIIDEIAGRPIDVRAGDAATGGTGIKITGSLEIDGRSGGNVPGGIFGPRVGLSDVDGGFVIGKEANKPKESWAQEFLAKTHASHPGSAWHQKTAADTSVGSGSRVITGSDIEIPADTVIRYCATVVARDSANGGSASFRVEGLFRRTTTGVDVIPVGSPTTTIIGYDGDGADYACALGIADLTQPVPDLINESVVLVVFGAAGKTVYWAATIDYQMVSQPT